MVRGRTPGRGTRRAGAAASSRSQADSSNSTDIANEEARTAAPVAAMTADPEAAGSSSGQNTTAISTTAAIRRGGPASRATRSATTGRFRPKNIRRDESERDMLAQQEEQKASARAADERRARGRSRFRSKRSRGDAMGSRGGAFGRPVSGASGPFGSGIGAGGKSGGGWFGGGPGGGGGGGGSFSRTGKFEGKAGPGFTEAGEGRYREARINADRLHAMAHEDDFGSEDEAMIAAFNSRSGSVMPMGIYRKEHKEAPVVVATAAELEAAENATGEEESLWIDDSGPSTVQPEGDEEGTRDIDSKNVKIKKEPTDEDAMDLDEVKIATESKNKGKQPIGKARTKKVKLQDPEETMIQTDLSLLASELGAVNIAEEEAGSESKEASPANKDGRLYLFQFPPLLPPLKQVAAPSRHRGKVKSEADEPGIPDNTPERTSSGQGPVDLTQDTGGSDPGSDEEDEDEEADLKKGFQSHLLSNGGLVGKLNVRKSGKVELDWGGQILEMSPAAGMNFLTTAVIVEESDDKPQNGVTGGESIGMGKIMGRFVLAPIWNEEDEWDVAPEELVIG